MYKYLLAMILVPVVLIAQVPPSPPFNVRVVTGDDIQPPSVPQGMAFSGKTETTVSLVWNASSDNIGVYGYHLYRNNVRVASTSQLTYTFTGLACGTTYTFGLEAYDASGNVSNRAEATGSIATDPCSGDGGGGGTDTPPPPSSTPTLANLWVSTTGGSCTRSATAAAFSQATSCGSFGAAYSAAQGGDTVRVKAGTYGQQHLGGSKSPAVVFIGESGAQVMNDGTQNRGLHFSGNVIVRSVNVGGVRPFVTFNGANNTWEDSRLLEATGLRTIGDAEPILIYDNIGVVRNTTLRNLVIEPQKGAMNAGNGDVYHLEMIRIDQNVDGVLIDRVTFEPCLNGSNYAGCGSGQIFITTPNASTFDPTNIVIRNSVFKGSPNYSIQIHSNVDCSNYTLAYNTFRNEPVLWSCANRSNIQQIGNIGPRPQSCLSGITYAKNVWQWSVGTPCGTDKLVIGPSYTLSALGLDANYRPLAGSPVIAAAESSYCTGPLGAVDRDGKSRPTGVACTGGGYEY